MRARPSLSLAALIALMTFGLSGTALAQANEQPSVQSLLEEGWEIAGYASNFEGRAPILFKHKDKKYLSQCSVLYDVTREERVVTNCYEVR